MLSQLKQMSRILWDHKIVPLFYYSYFLLIMGVHSSAIQPPFGITDFIFYLYNLQHDSRINFTLVIKGTKIQRKQYPYEQARNFGSSFALMQRFRLSLQRQLIALSFPQVF